MERVEFAEAIFQGAIRRSTMWIWKQLQPIFIPPVQSFSKPPKWGGQYPPERRPVTSWIPHRICVQHGAPAPTL